VKMSLSMGKLHYCRERRKVSDALALTKLNTKVFVELPGVFRHYVYIVSKTSECNLLFQMFKLNDTIGRPNVKSSFTL
jgi:hypothetical protein